MKIISLNGYFGHAFEALMDFIVQEASTTDVFCFQEMLSNPKEDISKLPYRGRANLLQEITRRLPEFSVQFAAMQDDYDIVPDYPQQLQLGLATFWKKNLPVSDSGSFFVYNHYNSYQPKDPESTGHLAAYIKINLEKPLTILHVHGNSEPASKRDSVKRLEQSKKILDFLSPCAGEKIVMGDFNLFPDTESIRMFEKAGFQNLITKYNIKTTRGSLIRTLFPEYANGPYGYQEFA
ncbi:MAG: endonuclease/exonuclease/phosphatase family protein, partial [Patescibacteria group bacterium]